MRPRFARDVAMMALGALGKKTLKSLLNVNPGRFIMGKTLEQVTGNNILDLDRLMQGKSKLRSDTKDTRDYELRRARMNLADEIPDNIWITDFASTNIKAIKYDIENEVLTVAFWSGGIYQYLDFPYEAAEDFLNADSKGEWFWENVRGGKIGNDQYNFIKIS